MSLGWVGLQFDIQFVNQTKFFLFLHFSTYAPCSGDVATFSLFVKNKQAHSRCIFIVI